jgi:hypothetical protein
MSKRGLWGRGVLLAICGSMIVPVMMEAILVSPHAIFMSNSQRTAEITLMNTGTGPEEVSVDFIFGYPASDTLGNVFIHFPDSVTDEDPSAVGFIRAFPRRLIITPGSRQVVRLLATPPSDLADGEYWTRVVVTSRGGPGVGGGTPDDVAAGVTLEVRTILSLAFRQGDVSTGLDMTRFSMGLENDSLILWIGLDRQGNSAYLGQINIDFREVTGDTLVAEWATPIAVYHELTRRYAFSVEHLPPGTYTAQFDLNNHRDDLPDQSVVLPADPVVRSVGLEILPR